MRNKNRNHNALIPKLVTYVYNVVFDTFTLVYYVKVYKEDVHMMDILDAK